MDPQYLEPYSLPLIKMSDEDMKKNLLPKCCKVLTPLRDECRRAKKHPISGEITDTILLPCNIPRIMENVLSSSGLHHQEPKITPKETNELVEALLHNVRQTIPTGYLFFETALRYYFCWSLLQHKHWTIAMIKKVLDEIQTLFYKSLAQAGEMIGALSSESIGEPSTQLSFVGETMLYYIENNQEKCGTIGDWVNQMILLSKSDNNNNNININKDSITVEAPIGYTSRILSTDEKGNVHWRRVTHWTKHPPNGNLVKVTTQSGKSVIAT